MKTDIIYNLLESNGFSISTDSRDISGGEIFFALKGENYDGNKFAGEALERGAGAAVVDDPSAVSGDKGILVDDVTAELQAVALKRRIQLNIPVIALTGSNGKTSTKELMARVLSRGLRVHFTGGNLNNHIGVPLTLLACPADDELMIIEMGANHRGEIARLCTIARPDYGLITNIGGAHLEGFASFEGIVEAKSELYDYLENSGGKVFYNPDNELLNDILSGRVMDKISYLKPGDHSLKIVRVSQDPRLSMVAEIDGIEYNFKTELFGLYNLENIVAALAVGLFFNVNPGEMQVAIASYIPDNNRSQIVTTARNTLICDSYNANPVSMSRSLDSFREAPGTNKMVILGDMRELGEYEKEEHEKILRKLASMADLKVILVGKVFHSLAADYGMLSFESRDQLIEYLHASPPDGCLVLIKASRAMGLEKIYELI